MNSIIFESDAARGEYASTGYVTCSYAAAGEAKEGQCGRHQDDAQGRVPHFPSGERLPKDAVLVWQQYSNVYDKYQFDQRILGKGLHGSVRQCIDRSTGEGYAVKSICKDNPKVKPQRLLREVSLLQEICHKSIIWLVEVIEDEDYVHLVTELCNGGELFDRIVKKSSDVKNDKPCFAEDEAARIIHQILSAVHYMHERGIVHRDIKPENVLFETADEDSPVKIIDFGLSRRHDNRVDRPITSIVGTPYYIAPEVFLRKYDKACDLLSFRKSM